MTKQDPGRASMNTTQSSNKTAQTSKKKASAKLSFAQLGLPEPICQGLQSLGYQQPTDIQQAAIPAVLAGRDLLAQAQTGSGKTAAFGLPLLARLEPNLAQIQALILTPTRELAQQVHRALSQYAQAMPQLELLCLFGGVDLGEQRRALAAKPHLLIATPGRLQDHLRRGHLELSQLKLLVLDEADEMLRLGFQQDVEWILDYLPSKRQSLLFSATLPDQLQPWIQQYLRDPLQLQLGQSQSPVAQQYWLLKASDRPQALLQLVARLPFAAAICFVRQRSSADQLAAWLVEQGVAATSLHGDMLQGERERRLQALRQGDVRLLIATDLAARGLDLDNLELVINYDPAPDSATHLHRIGRTGRAGRAGRAISFFTPAQQGLLEDLQLQLQLQLPAQPPSAGQALSPFVLPDDQQVLAQREQQLLQRLAEPLPDEQQEFYLALLARLGADSQLSSEQLAARLLARLYPAQHWQLPDASQIRTLELALPAAAEQGKPMPGRRKQSPALAPAQTMASYRVEQGQHHGLQAKQLLALLQQASGLALSQIQGLQVERYHAQMRLPAELSPEILSALQQLSFKGKPLRFDQDMDWQPTRGKSKKAYRHP